MYLSYPQNNTDLLSRFTLLYVEDDDDIRSELTYYLQKRVGRLITAQDGQEGLLLFQEHRPDLIVTDIRMPKMDGLELARAVRKLDQEIPIIVTTAYNDESYFLKAIEMGIDHYVLKPVDPKILVDALTKSAQSIWRRLEIESSNRYARFLLDIQPNMLVVVSRGAIEYANRPFLEFVECSSFEMFQMSCTGLGELLLAADNQSVLGQGEDWIRFLLERTKESAIIFLRPPGHEESGEAPFAVTCNSFPERDRHVFSFADISGIERQMRILEQKAFTDALTGVCNRAGLMAMLHAEMHRSNRHGSELGMMIFDIDHFKKVNDTYGHAVGDDVLRELTRLVAANLRATDLLARWGGEEFMVVSPECGLEAQKILAEKLRLLIANHPFPTVQTITSSFGVAVFHPGETVRSITERADQALYLAKKQGRNRVVCNPS